MKRLLIILTFLAFVAVAFAGTAMWPRDKKPTISLIDAANLATEALNKDGADFYCLRAGVLQSGEQSGDHCVWDMDFSSKNGSQRWVRVGADKSIKIRKDGPFGD